MSSGRVSTLAGYAGVAQTLARQALEVATDAAPHRAREGERRWAMAEALPAARVLIDQATETDHAALNGAACSLVLTLSEANGKITDGFGHHRPSYGLFALHLLGSAARLLGDDETLAQVRQAVEASLDASSIDPDPRLGIWRRLIALQHGLEPAEPLPQSVNDPAPLVPLGVDDLIDSWTYRELVGLHGLHLSSLLQNDSALAQRARMAALYHLGHTQPDYTTYQPWALSAFASNPQTAVFAEQQLHDVATHLSIEGPGSAVMPALLLADASAAMSGRLVQAWQGS